MSSFNIYLHLLFSVSVPLDGAEIQPPVLFKAAPSNIQGFESKPIIGSVIDPTTNAVCYQAFRASSEDIHHLMLATSPGKLNQPKNGRRRETPRDDVKIQVSVCRFKCPTTVLHRGGSGYP